MKLNQEKWGMAPVLIYIILAIFSVYELYSLQHALIYEAQALSITGANEAQPVFVRLYITIGATLFSGLAILIFLFGGKRLEVIYVEKKERNNSTHNDQEVENNNSFDIESIKNMINVNAESEEKIIDQGLRQICKSLDAGVGAFYRSTKDGEKKVLKMNATYAMSIAESQQLTFDYGEGLVGQVAQEEKALIIDDIPKGYIKVMSGLGSAYPTHVLLVPIKYDTALFGVVEIATFTEMNQKHLDAVKGAFESIKDKLSVKTRQERTKTASKKVMEEMDLQKNKKG